MSSIYVYTIRKGMKVASVRQRPPHRSLSIEFLTTVTRECPLALSVSRHTAVFAIKSCQRQISEVRALDSRSLAGIRTMNLQRDLRI